MLATTIQITNNPPHTTHTNNTTTASWLRRQPPPTGGGRSHGVEREPDSVLACPHHQTAAEKRFMPNPKTHPHPPPTIRAVNTCRHKKTTNTPTTRPTCCIVPHKTGLPRKEVIQPHLPVRLPCYDFVPIANPTFDHSPRKRG